jgi:hypothetical protein
MAIVDYVDTKYDGSLVSIELSSSDAKAVKPFRPGQVVKVLVVGTIVSQNFRKSEDLGVKGFEGSLTLEATDFKIEASARNEIAELFDDEDV